jgi:hypothetical protein
MVQPNMDNTEKFAKYHTQDEDKQIKTATQYVMDTTIHKRKHKQR